MYEIFWTIIIKFCNERILQGVVDPRPFRHRYLGVPLLVGFDGETVVVRTKEVYVGRTE